MTDSESAFRMYVAAAERDSQSPRPVDFPAYAPQQQRTSVQRRSAPRSEPATDYDSDEDVIGGMVCPAPSFGDREDRQNMRGLKRIGWYFVFLFVGVCIAGSAMTIVYMTLGSSKELTAAWNAVIEERDVWAADLKMPQCEYHIAALKNEPLAGYSEHAQKANKKPCREALVGLSEWQSIQIAREVAFRYGFCAKSECWSIVSGWMSYIFGALSGIGMFFKILQWGAWSAGKVAGG